MSKIDKGSLHVPSQKKSPSLWGDIIDSVSHSVLTYMKPQDILWKVSEGYVSLLDMLDKNGISPNKLVTIRATTSIAIGAILASTQNLSALSESALLAGLGLSLAADRVDGDLARHTQQCSKEGEVLDAGADKVVVYVLLACIVHEHVGGDISLEELALMLWVSFSFLLDCISQFKFRSIEDNLSAIKQCWSEPLSEEERVNNLPAKTKNAANIYGKVKTTSIMATLWLWLEDISNISDETKIQGIITLITVSLVMSGMSLGKKIFQKS